jgi:hypothetical protein
MSPRQQQQQASSRNCSTLPGTLDPYCPSCLQAAVASRLLYAAFQLAGQPTLTARQLAICCQRLHTAAAAGGAAGWARPSGPQRALTAAAAAVGPRRRLTRAASGAVAAAAAAGYGGLSGADVALLQQLDLLEDLAAAETDGSSSGSSGEGSGPAVGSKRGQEKVSLKPGGLVLLQLLRGLPDTAAAAVAGGHGGEGSDKGTSTALAAMQLLQQLGSENVAAATQAVQVWLQKVAHPAAEAAQDEHSGTGASGQCCGMWGCASIVWVSLQQQQQQQQLGPGSSAGSCSVREVWMPLARSEVEGTPVSSSSSNSSSSRCCLVRFMPASGQTHGLLAVQHNKGVLESAA